MHFTTVVLFVASAVLIGLCYGDVGASANPKLVSASSIQKVVNLYNSILLSIWQTLDTACDPNAVFALTYLYMTNGVRKLIQQSYFDDGDNMATFTANFAQRYIDAYDAYHSGNLNAVSSPWITAFDFAASGHSNVSQNLYLGMNAHINYDLGIAAWQSGKPDFDRINDLMTSIMNDISVDVALRYDSTLTPGSPITDILNYAVLQLTLTWRETAWGQAETYYLSPLTRTFAQTANAAYANTLAIPFTIPSSASTAADRVAYCQANHAPTW